MARNQRNGRNGRNPQEGRKASEIKANPPNLPNPRRIEKSATPSYIYGVAKPDGLTIGFVTPGLYFNQLTDMKEVQFDWARFTWIGSPEQTVRIIYGRSDTPYKTLDDIRNMPEHPRCGATALGTVVFPGLSKKSQ